MLGRPFLAAWAVGVDFWPPMLRGPVAAIRMPMLRVSNFKGTSELRQTCYVVLVLIIPVTEAKSWSTQELEIIKVVVGDHHGG
ncbi:hypothetical protein VIGAN_04134800 [Vigna angularis var. angularis]|uniref:Uncharacterized protein n=1 Tax=Vigna angularis var. angularis TaxID=157739 RepID=A0A0S3RU36_PHAAN|nr:hypothetical protein VIGAN_04134800 [Vigna angularis var. angularis]